MEVEGQLYPSYFLYLDFVDNFNDLKACHFPSFRLYILIKVGTFLDLDSFGYVEKVGILFDLTSWVC